jgi:outer membrane lipoprotein-sorting protein
MKSCKTTTLRPSFSIIWVLLLVFTFLLPTAITYPAFAMTDLAQSQMKENHELPASVLKAVQQDLSKQTNLPAEEFKLTNATHESWTDGCLGLRKPEEMCSQALIDGWRVIVSRGKQTWVYRTDTNGRVIRQEE